MVKDRFSELIAGGTRCVIDLAAGHIRTFQIDWNGRLIEPLHTAPWVDDPEIARDPEIPGNLKYLSGDFFCAPFGAYDIVNEAPPHGWPANSPWHLIDQQGEPGLTVATYELEKRVFGARVLKEISLRQGHPFIYQRHVLQGGEGRISAACHPMTHIAGKGRLSFSPKAFAELPPEPLEPDPARGRSVFARSTRFTDLSRLPLADGTIADATRYPVAEGHEDFVMLVEEKDARMGWAAVVRFAERDIFLCLKNSAEYPATCLWFSNGGRSYSPWNGRHTGVLGVEEVRAYSSLGHAASIAPNPLEQAGIPTSLELQPNGSVSLRHVVGGIGLPDEWQTVEAVEASEGVLCIKGDAGEITVPFDTSFLVKEDKVHR